MLRNWLYLFGFSCCLLIFVLRSVHRCVLRLHRKPAYQPGCQASLCGARAVGDSDRMTIPGPIPWDTMIQETFQEVLFWNGDTFFVERPWEYPMKQLLDSSFYFFILLLSENNEVLDVLPIPNCCLGVFLCLVVNAELLLIFAGINWQVLLLLLLTKRIGVSEAMVAKLQLTPKKVGYYLLEHMSNLHAFLFHSHVRFSKATH